MKWPAKGDLTWDNITVASKIMVPAYVGFFGTLALSFLFTGVPDLVKTPGLRYADHIMTIRGWGLLFSGVVIVMVIALIQRHRSLFRWALIMGAISMAIWAVLMVFAVTNAGASPSAFSWPAFIGGACIASNRSLLKGET